MPYPFSSFNHLLLQNFVEEQIRQFLLMSIRQFHIIITILLSGIGYSVTQFLVVYLSHLFGVPSNLKVAWRHTLHSKLICSHYCDHSIQSSLISTILDMGSFIEFLKTDYGKMLGQSCSGHSIQIVVLGQPAYVFRPAASVFFVK